MIEVKAPHGEIIYRGDKTLFLSGSIDQGKAVKWQDEIVNHLKDVDRLVIFNPRRDDWDSTWITKIENPQFKEQVEWEISRITQADIVCVVFDPAGQAPITLLELGLIASMQDEGYGQQIIVCCPEGYWRKGNVDIVCEWYGVKQVNTFEELKKRLKELCTL